MQEQGGQVEEMGGVTVDRTAMAAFAEHALQTNEIFLLAAKVRLFGAERSSWRADPFTATHAAHDSICCVMDLGPVARSSDV